LFHLIKAYHPPLQINELHTSTSSGVVKQNYYKNKLNILTERHVTERRNPIGRVYIKRKQERN